MKSLIELCRVLLEDQARSGIVTLTVVRQSPDQRTNIGTDSDVAAHEGFQNQDNRSHEVMLLISNFG